MKPVIFPPNKGEENLPIKKTGRYLALALLAGVTYAVFVNQTGIAVPCMFHRITGLKCPGCGVTTMCIAMMHFDLKTAYYSNQMLFVLLPVLGWIFGSYTLSYVKNGHGSLSKVQTVFIYICIVLLLLFTVYRNIFRI